MEGRAGKTNRMMDVGFLDANLNSRVIWARPSLWAGDWCDEFLTLHP